MVLIRSIWPSGRIKMVHWGTSQFQKWSTRIHVLIQWISSKFIEDSNIRGLEKGFAPLWRKLEGLGGGDGSSCGVLVQRGQKLWQGGSRWWSGLEVVVARIATVVILEWWWWCGGVCMVEWWGRPYVLRHMMLCLLSFVIFYWAVHWYGNVVFNRWVVQTLTLSWMAIQSTLLLQPLILIKSSWKRIPC